MADYSIVRKRQGVFGSWSRTSRITSITTWTVLVRLSLIVSGANTSGGCTPVHGFTLIRRRMKLGFASHNGRRFDGVCSYCGAEEASDEREELDALWAACSHH